MYWSLSRDVWADASALASLIETVAIVVASAVAGGTSVSSLAVVVGVRPLVSSSSSDEARAEASASGRVGRVGQVLAVVVDRRVRVTELLVAEAAIAVERRILVGRAKRGVERRQRPSQSPAAMRFGRPSRRPPSRAAPCGGSGAAPCSAGWPRAGRCRRVRLRARGPLDEADGERHGHRRLDFAHPSIVEHARRTGRISRQTRTA